MNHKVKCMCVSLAVCILLSACSGGGGKNGYGVVSPDSDEQSALTQPESNLTEQTIAVSKPTDEAKKPSAPKPSNEPQKSEPTQSMNDLSDETVSDVLKIGEKMFLTQINDIYFNFDTYKDKTIVVEGMYALLYSMNGDERIPAVYRRGPGCCGNDGWGGFLLKYDGDFPEENEWICVTGTPELEKDGYFVNLYLNVSSIEVKEERGAEFVVQ